MLSQWQMEHDAQVAKGEICKTCGKYYPKMWVGGSHSLYPGYPVNCASCDEIFSSKPLSHHKFVRCPKCHMTFEATDEMSEKKLFQVWCGETIEMSCPHCDCDFMVETRCEVTFTSPALEEEPIIEEESEENDD
jgi:hypothetical protein